MEQYESAACQAIAQPIEAAWRVSPYELLKLKTVWYYAILDPYAVTAVFEPETRDEVSWTFSRELLHAALTAQQLGVVTLGDVRLAAGGLFSTEDLTDSAWKSGVQMQLVAQDSSLSNVLIPRPDLESFFKQSQIILPLGAESAVLLEEIDGDLATIPAEQPDSEPPLDGDQ